MLQNKTKQRRNLKFRFKKVGPATISRKQSLKSISSLDYLTAQRQHQLSQVVAKNGTKKEKKKDVRKAVDNFPDLFWLTFMGWGLRLKLSKSESETRIHVHRPSKLR